MRIAVVVVAVAVSAIASAQPATEPRATEPPAAGPGTYAPGTYAPGTYAPPPGGYYAPPPYAYQPPPPPTPEEQALMASGYVSDGQTIGGGLLSIFVGFGTGQAVEGRWRERGWLFTVMDAVSWAAIVGGAAALAAGESCSGSFLFGGENCDSSAEGKLGGTMFGLGIASLVVFRIWEIGDAFGGPGRHNLRVHELRHRYGHRDYARNIAPYISRPQAADGGMTAGIALRF